MPDAVQAATNLDQFFFDRLQLLTLLPRQTVHLLIEHLHQLTDVALSQDVLTQLVNDQPFKLASVQPRSFARILALFEQGEADVVGVLPTLRL